MATLSGLEPPVLRRLMEAHGVRLADVVLGRSASAVIVDRGLRILEVVGPMSRTPGFEPEALVGRRADEVLMHPDDRPWLIERYRGALAGEPQDFELLAPSGDIAHRVQMLPLRGEDPDGPAVISIVEDVTEQIHTTMKLARAEARLAGAERMVGVGSWEYVLTDRSITFTAGYARALGLGEEEALDLDRLLERIHPEDRSGLLAAIDECLRSGTARGVMRIMRADGSMRLFDVTGERVLGANGRPLFIRGALLDVTAEREAERERLQALSLFQQGFEAAPIGMALVEPETGRCTRVNDALCRLLGRPREELLSLSLHEVTHEDEREASIDTRESLRQGRPEHNVERRYVRPDGSIVWGAVHLAPVAGREGPVTAIFAQIVDITERKQREAAMERELEIVQWLARIRDALDHDRLVLYAQPIVDLRTGETVQRELLLRMIGEDGEIIGPNAFLPAAERYGLISEIDRWVIRQSVEMAAGGMACEFNLSAASLDNPTVLSTLQEVLAETGADPSLLVVEVTETAMMGQVEAGRAFAHRVRELGCGLALDDFGTGFASLSYLKHLPAGHLKIDIEFVRELIRDANDERVVRGIVALAREFGQVCVAEGIEDEDTLIALRALGVEYGQGYLFGRPQPLGEGREASAPVSSTHPRDPISTARAIFAMFGTENLEQALEFLHPDIVLRPYRTMEVVGRPEPYRGHEGIRRYAADVAATWERLELHPTAFRQTAHGVIAFGQLVGTREGRTETTDVVWILRFRDGLLASVDTAMSAIPGTGPRS